jgi:nuclear pore complex protein Nup85
VQDQLSARTGFCGKFVTNELLSLHAFDPAAGLSRDGPSKHANTAPVNVIHVSESFILDDEVVRSLVAESCNIFYNLQVAREKSNDVFLQTSRVYRSAIRLALNKLQEAVIEDGITPAEVKKYESYITIFYSIECLWHLVEFLLIDRSTLSVVPNLLEWVRTILSNIVIHTLTLCSPLF